MTHLSTGDEAPNFDLTPTEAVVLMLRDEVSRTAVLLYFFDAERQGSREALATLAEAFSRLGRHRARVFGVAGAEPEALKELQRQLELPFPLLSDDRGFSAYYGVEAAAEGVSPPPGMFLVDRRQRIAWMANPAPAMEEALSAVERALGELPGPSSNYPKSVVNRVVNWWVNAMSRRRPAGTAG
ncbi:MAG: peroxiredoxin family protein [Thermoanaerobaculia bacterium]